MLKVEFLTSWLTCRHFRVSLKLHLKRLMLLMTRRNRTLTVFLRTMNLLYRNCSKQLTGSCGLFTLLWYWQLANLHRSWTCYLLCHITLFLVSAGV